MLLQKEMVKCVKEINEKVGSCDIIGIKPGNNYIQCIAMEVTEAERQFLVKELNCFEQPFKDGLKVRFYLPVNVKIVGIVKN